jgi:hypothetical protein
MWTDEQPNQSSDTDVWLRSSDDAGVTWSAPVRVNDVTTNAQFLPRIALDPTTGNLAFGWHDARNDLGDHGTGDTDGRVNTDAMYYVTFSTDGERRSHRPSRQRRRLQREGRPERDRLRDCSGLAFSGVACPPGRTTPTARATILRLAEDVRYRHGT